MLNGHFTNPIYITFIFFNSYDTDTEEYDLLIKKITTGDNAPINRVYKPEFVTLAPPLLNCQDEVRIY